MYEMKKLYFEGDCAKSFGLANWIKPFMFYVSKWFQYFLYLAAKNLTHARAGCILAGYLKFFPLFIMVLKYILRKGNLKLMIQRSFFTRFFREWFLEFYIQTKLAVVIQLNVSKYVAAKVVVQTLPILNLLSS